MSTQSVKTKQLTKRTKVAMPLIIILMPLTMVLFWKMGERGYVICSLLLIIYSMVPFFLRFENKKPQPRELVTIAVMCAIAVASRAIFIMLPNFKPMAAIIMITGMAFGAEAGFLAGAVSAFVSNFIFGQGAWTPWQMFAFGIAGFLAGILGKKGIMTPERKLLTAAIGGSMIILIVGPLLDTSTVVTLTTMVNEESNAAIYLSGLPINAVHGAATAVTLFLLCRPMMEKLDRLKLKYGMLSEEDNEI